MTNLERSKQNMERPRAIKLLMDTIERIAIGSNKPTSEVTEEEFKTGCQDHEVVLWSLRDVGGFRTLKYLLFGSHR